jgi:hypothetical protein
MTEIINLNRLWLNTEIVIEILNLINIFSKLSIKVPVKYKEMNLDSFEVLLSKL